MVFCLVYAKYYGKHFSCNVCSSHNDRKTTKENQKKHGYHFLFCRKYANARNSFLNNRNDLDIIDAYIWLLGDEDPSLAEQ